MGDPTAHDDRARDEQPAPGVSQCRCPHRMYPQPAILHIWRPTLGCPAEAPVGPPAPAGDDELREVEGKVRDFLAQHGDENVERVMAEYDERGRELERLHTWAGLMSLLDEHYPHAVFTGESGDEGPRIITLIGELDRLRAIEARARDLLTNPDEDETWKHAARYLREEEAP